jgi:DNA-binding transcriptional ArsR family regulator
MSDDRTGEQREVSAMRATAHPVRLQILSLLTGAELSAAEIARELDRHGFRIVSTHKQFVIPIALHKAMRSATLTRSLEAALATVGLLKLAGSPVTVAAERCAS